MNIHSILKQILLSSLLCLLLCTHISAEEEKEPARPNILFIFADDQRADTISAHGNPQIKTPHLDRLAENGFSFRRNYCAGSFSGAVCVASRAMLMTGMTWQKLENGGGNWKGRLTLPRRLENEGGYAPFIIGKWHNGLKNLQDSFSHGASVFMGGMADHTDFSVQDYQDGKLGIKKEVTEFSTTAFATEAIRFLESASEEKPFFLYLSLTAPHDPRNPPQKYRDLYYENRPPLPANFLPIHPFNHGGGDLKGRDESLAAWPRSKEVVSDQLCEYYGLITHLDEQVGRIISALENSPHAENTIIVYTADHGLAMGSHGLLGKQSVYEHSMRSPLIISGPGVPKGGSTESGNYIHDLYATLCDFAQVSPPADLSSRSLRPVLQNPTHAVHDSIFLPYQEHQRAVSDGRWKLLIYPKVNHQLLFNLEEDPHERHDLAADPTYADELKRMHALMEKARTEHGDTVPLRSDTPQDLTFTPPAEERRFPDKWQPEWIRKKYFSGRETKKKN